MQGFNMGRYVPPDLEGSTSFNAASGKGHALGSRARKLKTEGVLTVRFECPFAIWCTHCQPEQIIGQGVRFNAEKKKVGNYLSTPVWSFRFKHTVCGQWLVVQTDPQNAEYVVVDGGRRRDTGADKLLDGEIRIGVSEEDKERLEREGGFGMLEKKVEDKKVMDSQRRRLDDLAQRSDRDWADPYEMSRKLRKGFRAERRTRQNDEKTGEALKDKFGLGVDLLPGTEEDAARVKYIEFGHHSTKGAVSKPMLAHPESDPVRIPAKDRGKRGKTTKVVDRGGGKASQLQTELRANTWSAVDPFLREKQLWQSELKRKRKQSPEQQKGDKQVQPQPVVALVTYDSDST